MLRAMHLIVTNRTMAFEPKAVLMHRHGGGTPWGHGHGTIITTVHGRPGPFTWPYPRWTCPRRHSHADMLRRPRPVAHRSIPVVAQGHVHGPDCNHDH